MALTILGIESSCDETAAAVYSTKDGILSNIIFSQIDLHKQYGGVIPELASQSHLEKMNGIVSQALDKAGMNLSDINVVAVTNKPGLAGSLLIGVCFAKAMAWAAQKKIIGINHLEGHIFSSFLEHSVPFPHLCLTASGGHTALYLVHDFGVFELLGQTLDDAAGEAFDKIAKVLGLSYPGGPVIERYAQAVNFVDFCHYPRVTHKTFDFSFSGLKTAVLYDLVDKNLYSMATKQLSHTITELDKQHVSSSLLVCINDIFKAKIALALKKYPTIKAVTFVGGVACNKFIKQQMRDFCTDSNIQFFTPSAQYCTDNAAMIAFVGSYKAKQGLFADYTLDIFMLFFYVALLLIE